MALETLPFDPADCIKSPKAQQMLLREALKSGDQAFIAVALATLARARGLAEVARELGITIEALNLALAR